MKKRQNRRRHWKQSYAAEAAIYTFFAVSILVSSEGNGGLVLSGLGFFMAYLAVCSYRRGWKMSYDLPPWGERQMRKKGLAGEVARKAWAETQKEARNPNRKRYAFETEKTND